MSIAERFKQLVSQQPLLADMVDNVTEKPWGCTYVFDGYVGCHLVFQDGVYYDVQDQLLDWEPDPVMRLTTWARNESLEVLVQDMNDLMDGFM